MPAAITRPASLQLSSKMIIPPVTIQIFSISILLFNYYPLLGWQLCMTSQQPHPSKYSFDADTEDSEIKAPRPRPMEPEELLPEFKLQDPEQSEESIFSSAEEDTRRNPFQRKGSLDMHYSILGFIDRKIREKSRQRIMSEELSHLHI